MRYKTAFIIGNGESRKGIDIDGLKKYGVVFGCNAIVRDFNPDYVVALDRKMEQEIESTGFKGYRIYRQIGNKETTGDYKITIGPHQVCNSGVAAVYCALKIGYKDIWLLGFDLSQNNLYAGTTNYSRFSAHALGSPPRRVQIHIQIGKWATMNPQIQFRRLYDPATCYDPKEWAGVISNVTRKDFYELYP